MSNHLPDLQAAYDGGSPAPPPTTNKNHLVFSDRRLGTKTLKEEDWDMFYRYWRYVRRARKKRDFKEAAYWLDEMRALKRFLTTRVEDRHPDIFSKCHGALSFLFNSGLEYSDVDDMTTASISSVKGILIKAWREVSVERARQVYEDIISEAKRRGYEES